MANCLFTKPNSVDTPQKRTIGGEAARTHRLPLLIHTGHFPFGSYHAITLFPFIFYKGHLSARDLRHERIHLWQQATLLVIPFYILYLAFWLAALLRYRNAYRAYRNIPFERSAYYLECRPDSRPLTMAFDWLRHMTSP